MNRKLLFLIYCTFLLSGCATVPLKEPGLISYNINGISYVPLLSLCDLLNISWDYDTFSRTIALTKGPEQINLMLGSPTVIINGTPKDIGQPVDIYNGAVVVPYRFKKEVIDSLFKPGYIPKRQLPTYIKKIIIDPGHGGNDPGAIGATGLKEKHVCLDIGRRLKALLAHQDIEVVMSRNSDRTVSLSERTALANSADADLSISIHANANRVHGLNGFEVYYLSPKIDDSARALSTAKGQDLKLENAYFLNQSLELKATVWDLIYTQNRAESIELAQHICRAVNVNSNTKVLGIKYASFHVLKASRMPALLIEVGFLSNSEEEKRLRNNFYRQQIAEAIAQGIESYCRGYTITQAQK